MILLPNIQFGRHRSIHNAWMFRDCTYLNILCQIQLTQNIPLLLPQIKVPMQPIRIIRSWMFHYASWIGEDISNMQDYKPQKNYRERIKKAANEFLWSFHCTVITDQSLTGDLKPTNSVSKNGRRMRFNG